MDEQRERARPRRARRRRRRRAVARARRARFARRGRLRDAFTGYETDEQATTVGRGRAPRTASVLVKLAESPFYAAGGGQVADAGAIECERRRLPRARRGRLPPRRRPGARASRSRRASCAPGERVIARVDRARAPRHRGNHTATHLLQAALRERLGTHVRQAGSYVGPGQAALRLQPRPGADAPRSCATSRTASTSGSLANDPVRALTTTLDEARALGAMALFGEKYGDVVRMVEVGDGSYSRELCGGTHVRSTAEIGAFRITQETSSAANVRRIEAVTGPGGGRAAARARRPCWREVARRAAHAARGRWPRRCARSRGRAQGAREAAASSGGGRSRAPADLDALAGRARGRSTARTVLADAVAAPDAKALLALADRLKGRLGRRRDRARRGGGRARPPRRERRAGARRARRQGRRRRQGGRRGRRRRRRRARHDGAGGRPRPRASCDEAHRRRARGDRGARSAR